MSTSTAQLIAENQTLKALLLDQAARLAQRDTQLAAQDATLVQRSGEVLQLSTLIEKLKLQIALLKRARFGRSSEQLDTQIMQLELIVDELEADQGEHAQRGAPQVAALPATDTDAQAPAPKHPRKLTPEHLPRDVVMHAAPCACPNCGGTTLRALGEDVAEQLEFVPEHFKVIRHVRPKLSCVTCQTVVQADAPSRPVAKSPVGAGLLAHVLVSKYVDHLPLYRQSEIYARQGVEIARSTMADWVGAAHYTVRPLVDAIKRHVFKAAKVHTDDTPIDVLQPGRKTTKQGRLWVYVRDDTASADKTPPAVWFTYSQDRKAEHPRAHLKDYVGLQQADAYAGYAKGYASGKITEVACWAHARRKFEQLAVAIQSPLAKLAVLKIAALYEIEKRIRGEDASKRWQTRQTEAVPLLAALKTWLMQTLQQTSIKGDLGQAIAYSLNRWAALTRYCDYGIAEIDNNIAERQIRPIALGRKNYLFAGSDSGGERAAAIYSLVGTAKMHGLDPEAYLKYVFERINDHKVNAIDQLLPWSVAKKIAEQTLAKRKTNHQESVAA